MWKNLDDLVPLLGERIGTQERDITTNLPSGRGPLCDMVDGTPIESASFRSIRSLASRQKVT